MSQTIAQLAREASIEINVQDLGQLDASRAFLSEGKRMYISHLPKQTWDDTLLACRAVRNAGFDPIPHIPVRLLESERTLDRVLEQATLAGTNEVLLVAGDYRKAVGPYSVVADVLRSGKLEQHRMQRVSFAGHPEGHPTVPLAEIRRAELEKAVLAERAGLQTTFVTQFFFESQPFLDWVRGAKAAGINARLVGGLSGPASIKTLFRFALRCGVGPSIRALGVRPSAIARLLGDYGPEAVMHELAEARDLALDFANVHLFCFGGFLRTCQWLHRAANTGIALSQGCLARDTREERSEAE
jgi:methylenetetrahydrofolate reductase (NADPH)